jgi:hypothetical protein
MNYWMCEYARQKGFRCVDNFAQFMGADYDSNGDGQIDSDAQRYTSFTNGKSPIWNQYGHERIGWGLSTTNPAAP